MTENEKRETPNDKFRRLASVRTNAILEKLQLLGNLADTRNYQYSDEEVSKIFSAINNKLKDTRGKFKTNNQRKFSL